MNGKDIRWLQRFDNFHRAYTMFHDAVMRYEQLSDLEKEGLIQRFEYTFELAWKTMKDYLEAQGVITGFPREVIKSAFHYNIIKDGDVWMDMLEKRNILAHTYDEERFKQAVALVKDTYFEHIAQVLKNLGELKK